MMTADETVVAAFQSRREPWLLAWAEFLSSSEASYIYVYEGEPRVFAPSPTTPLVLARLVEHADGSGMARVPMSQLAASLDLRDSFQVVPHLHALVYHGAIERFSKPGTVNRYRLALERLPSTEKD
jgi:hypothetical protein